MKYFLSLLICISSLLFSKEKYRQETTYSVETYTLSIGSIFQNEAPYLKEWIDYHKAVGVEHFFLYNNNSTDHYLAILIPYIDSGCVTLIEWPSIQETNDWAHYSFSVQTGAYNDAINRCRHRSKWLALIDIDEFIVPVKYDNIVRLLETDYPDVSGLCINWQCYGTSFGIECPWIDESCYILDSLTWKMKWNHEWNKTSKSIVQPLHVTHCPNPHYCLYTSNHWHVDSKRNPCNMCCSEVNINKIRINHYWTRDESFFFGTKIPRHMKWGSNIDSIKQHASSMSYEFDPMLSKERD